MSCTMETRTHASRGRALHASQSFGAGQTMHTFTKPLILHPTRAHLGSICTHCLRPGSPRACSRCHAAYYCDAACQRAGWAAVHSIECKPLRARKSGAAELPTPVRVLVQALLSEDIRRGLAGLEGNMEARRGRRGWADLEMMAMAACAFAGRQGDEEDVKEAVELLCKVIPVLQTSSGRLLSRLWELSDVRCALRVAREADPDECVSQIRRRSSGPGGHFPRTNAGHGQSLVYPECHGSVHG